MDTSKVCLSVLDRLSDLGQGGDRGATAEDLKRSLYRDLSILLNTKRADDDLEAFGSLQDSLIAYGLPDFTSFSLKNPSDQSRLRRAIEIAIRRFEPRLASVSVTMEERGEFDPVLRFRVNGLLKVKPHPQRLSFDTVLQADVGRFVVVDG